MSRKATTQGPAVATLAELFRAEWEPRFTEWASKAAALGAVTQEAADAAIKRFFDRGWGARELGVDPNEIQANTIVNAFLAYDDSGSMKPFEGVMPQIINGANANTVAQMGRNPILYAQAGFNAGLDFSFTPIERVPFMAARHYRADDGTPLYLTTVQIVDILVMRTIWTIGSGRESCAIGFVFSDGEEASVGMMGESVAATDVATAIRAFEAAGSNMLFGIAFKEEARAAFLDMGLAPERIKLIGDQSESGLTQAFQAVSQFVSGASQADGSSNLAQMKTSGLS